MSKKGLTDKERSEIQARILSDLVALYENGVAKDSSVCLDQYCDQPVKNHDDYTWLVRWPFGDLGSEVFVQLYHTKHVPEKFRDLARDGLPQ